MSQAALTSGTFRYGFTVQEVTLLPELNSTLLQLRHDRTGARLVHLASADDNNLFGVAFRTTPKDSTGVAHILEHTVLCGSGRYPVRDPFFAMLKRSLNTFMNAMTASDWTLYPFATRNQKDFYNLLGIYLDAAFFPLLREEDFRQEGHRLEFADPADPSTPLERKGVVYNEMKGAMADPSSLLGRRMNRALYPTTTYGHNSGGEPSAIPTLTYEELKAFHGRFYHPSNAYFFTYGNLPLEEHLRFIEENALSRFDALSLDSSIPNEERFAAPRRVTETFPVDQGEPLEGRSLVQVAWLTCPAADHFERTSLSVLAVLLLGNPAAPLYKALLDSRLGQNLAPGTGYHDDARETSFAAGLQGADPESMEKIEEVILTTLRNCAKGGFPQERIEAALHQLEFAHREVTGDQYPYGLTLLMRMLGPWLHGDDPVSPLRLAEDIARIRQEAQAGPFFQNLLRRHLLDNPHRVTLLLRPDPGQKEREEKETAKELERLHRDLDSGGARKLVQQAATLKASQEAKEDLACLPTLGLADIPAEEAAVSSTTQDIAGVPTWWFPQPTNGIVYFNAHLPAANVPVDLRPLLPAFCALLPQIGAAGHSYTDMAERISAATGGVRANTALLENPGDLGSFSPVLEVRAKALLSNRQPLFDILADLFRAPDFTDLERLHTVISQVKVSFENSIPASGHSFAARAAASTLTVGGRQREEWGGLQQLRRIRELAALAPSDLAPFAERLQAIAGILFDRSRLRCSVTAEEPAFGDLEGALGSFLSALPTGSAPPSPAPPSLQSPPGRLGFSASVPVSYVARVFRTVPYTHPDAPGLLVLAKLLRAGFLHREIREKGGAYGGMASCDSEGGLLSLLSYRDPHLVRTLQVFRQAAEWASAQSFDDEAVREAILSVFGDLDRPLSPGGKGYREFGNLQQGLTHQMRQAFRQGALAASGKSLSLLAERYLLGAWEESAVGVVAGEEMLRKANQDLGDQPLVISKA